MGREEVLPVLKRVDERAEGSIVAKHICIGVLFPTKAIQSNTCK